MNPKEAAKRIIDKLNIHVSIIGKATNQVNTAEGELVYHSKVQLALIMVDMLLDTKKDYDFWIEVKNEIKKM